MVRKSFSNFTICFIEWDLSGQTISPIGSTMLVFFVTQGKKSVHSHTSVSHQSILNGPLLVLFSSSNVSFSPLALHFHSHSYKVVFRVSLFSIL